MEFNVGDRVIAIKNPPNDPLYTSDWDLIKGKTGIVIKKIIDANDAAKSEYGRRDYADLYEYIYPFYQVRFYISGTAKDWYTFDGRHLKDARNGLEIALEISKKIK